MRTPLIACGLLFWTLSIGFAMTNRPIKVIDTISGTSVLAIRAALPAFDRAKLKLAEYRVKVGEDDSSIYVSCSDPDKSPEFHGSRDERPELTVVLSKGDLRILKSYYNR
jgi:hypothetical protein